MSQLPTTYAPDIAGLITEDDTPVDNLPSEKLQRLLTEPLYTSWAGPGPGRPFLAAANVGVFYLAGTPAIVPDVFVSVDVEVAEHWWQREHRSYFLWEFGKPPDVVIEIVSNTVGEENDDKKRKYASIGVRYYVIYDSQRQVMPDVLTIYQWSNGVYLPHATTQLPPFQLGLTLWDGDYEGKHDRWLRWTDAHGALLLTGKEGMEQERQRVEQERQRVEQERQRAEQEHQRAEQERQRAEHAEQRIAYLEERLRQLGQHPDQL